VTRDEIIGKLAEKFGHHTRPEIRPPDEDHRREWFEYAEDGNDAEGTAFTVLRDEDGNSVLRALTYGEIADAILLGEL
jgi:hypothetical protein